MKIKRPSGFHNVKNKTKKRKSIKKLWKIWFQTRAVNEVFYTKTSAKNVDSAKAVEGSAAITCYIINRGGMIIYPGETSAVPAIINILTHSSEGGLFL